MKEALLTLPLLRTMASAPPVDDHEAKGIASSEEIYDRHVVFVWRTLRALGISGNALEDAVQDVFVVVHHSLASFEGRARVTTWLFEIARRVASNYRRSRPPSEELSAVEDLRDPRPTPFDEAAATEAVQMLEQIIERLGEKYRVCFVLIELEQMSAEEVASVLGINVNTVYSRLHRARLEFDRLVARYGVDL